MPPRSDGAASRFAWRCSSLFILPRSAREPWRHLIERAEIRKRLRCEPALVVRVQLKQVAARMRHATHFGEPLFASLRVAAKSSHTRLPRQRARNRCAFSSARLSAKSDHYTRASPPPRRICMQRSVGARPTCSGCSEAKRRVDGWVGTQGPASRRWCRVKGVVSYRCRPVA